MARNLLRSALKDTFGKTVDSMRRKGVISGVLEERLKHILEECNWLVHRSRVDSERALEDQQSFKALEDRIKILAKEVNPLMKSLSEMAVKFTGKSGVPKERTRVEKKELLSK